MLSPSWVMKRLQGSSQAQRATKNPRSESVACQKPDHGNKRSPIRGIQAARKTTSPPVHGKASLSAVPGAQKVGSHCSKPRPDGRSRDSRVFEHGLCRGEISWI
uniref:Uncharacterized protein n=1 Tax=Micrurus lemniscatus lemniscatus TaxID=129467 RepID=A0A2D4HVS2_MICLE